MKRLIFLATFLLAVGAHAADTTHTKGTPYNPAADAKADVQHALALAQKNHKPVLLFFGANWCEDCRSLAASLKQPGNAELMARDFNVVKVDVGNFDHNLDVANTYGNPIGKGIPAAVIVSPADKLLYSTKAGELSNARRMSADGVHDFFEKAVQQTRS
jgi:protein disulfide-isomerase